MNKYLKFLGVGVVCVYFLNCIGTYTQWHFIDNVNLIFHEAGHTIFFFLGEYVQILMGSGFQILLPLGIALYFFFHNQKISGSICILWVGQNLLNVSVYAGDALKMQLDLLGGDSTIHDWNYLLSVSGLITHTDTIAKTIYIAGVLTILLGCLLTAYYTFTDERRS